MSDRNIKPNVLLLQNIKNGIFCVVSTSTKEEFTKCHRLSTSKGEKERQNSVNVVCGWPISMNLKC